MLNKRHKTKLRELSKRVRSTKEVYDFTLETNQDATAEIEELLSKFDPTLTKVHNVSTELTVLSSSSELEDLLNDILRETSSQNKKSENFNHDQSGPHQDFDEDGNFNPRVDDVAVPGWAKKLRKEVSKLCHPDMLGRLDISEAEKERRTDLLFQMNRAIEDQDFDMVLVIGIELDVYTDELPPMNQKRRIQKAWQRANRATVKLRETIAYQWSEDWSNTQFKVDIVTLFLQKKGLPVPSKLKIIEIVKEWESIIE